MTTRQIPCGHLIAVAFATFVLLGNAFATYCLGAQGCNGSENGPAGVPWSQQPCQNFTNYSGSCNGSTFLFSGTGSVRRTYYPTNICASGESGCVNVPGYKCWEMEVFTGQNCTGSSFWYICPKDAACRGTMSPPE